MRHLVLSDIHSNIEALDAVLSDARKQGFDRSVVLGDIVGYGGSPNEVIDCLRDLAPAVVVRGNHDKAASGITEGETFNDLARAAVLWTRAELTPQNRRYLLDLPEGPLDAGGFLIAHGSPLDEEEYILGEVDAAMTFEEGAFDVAFFGHTHFTCCFAWSDGRSKLTLISGDAETLRLEPKVRYLINPGSIGQPRDHNPKASYAIYDPERRALILRRVGYDVHGARARIEAAGLPLVLGDRLVMGI